LPAPERGKLVEHIEVDIGIGGNVLQAEVIDHESPTQHDGGDHHATPDNNRGFVGTHVNVDPVAPESHHIGNNPVNSRCQGQQ